MYEGLERRLSSVSCEAMRVYANQDTSEPFGVVLWVRRKLAKPVEYGVSGWYGLGSGTVDLGPTAYFPVMHDGLDAIIQLDEARKRFMHFVTEGGRILG